MFEKERTDIVELFHQKSIVNVCAPMVRYSKLQFRNLVKSYGCDLTFTPMILADSFCKSPKARQNEFTTNRIDTPLVTQFAANTVHDFVGASYLVAPYCDGVDLNCGCPQRWAREMNLGCELLKDPQLVFELVRQCRNRIAKPFTVSVKTRIQKSDRINVELCRGLEKCGVSFLTVHARTAENNVGPINEQSLKLLTESVAIPVVGNGGMGSLEEVFRLQERTGVKGVMVANGILNNPEIFSGASATSLSCVQKWLDICYNSTLTLETYEILTEGSDIGIISDRPFNLTFQCFHHHLVFMLEKMLSKKQRRAFNNLKDFRSVLDFLHLTLGLRPRLFEYDEFLDSRLMPTGYNERESLYHDIRPSSEQPNALEDLLNYDCAQTDGQYFKNKCDNSNECDWSNMFFECV